MTPRPHRHGAASGATRRGARALVAGLAIVVTGPLAACGSGTPGQSSAEDADGRVVVDFWQRKFTDPEDAWYEGTVEAYNASQDEVRIDLTVVPADAWDQKMKAAQAAGSAPDVYTLTVNNVPQAVRLGQVAPLSDHLDADAFADLTETALADVTVDGKQYAYPMLYEPQQVLYYRTDLLAEAGLDGPPTSWDQLLDHGKALTTDDVFGLLGAQDGPTFGWSSWGVQYDAAGHLPISDDWSTARADDPGYVPLLQLYQDLQSSGVMPKQALAPYPDATPFGEGKAAMMTNGTWAMSQLLEDFPELVGDIGVAPMPTSDGDTATTTSFLGGWKWVVDAKSDTTAEAADFIGWALAGDPGILVDYFTATRFSKFAARSSVTDAIAASPDADTNPWRAVVADEVMPYALPEPTYDWQVSEAFGLAMERAQKGEDPVTALAQAQATITDVIAKEDLAGKGTS